MGKPITLLLLILTTLHTISSSTAAPTTTTASAAATNYIKASCKSVTYPSVCLESLSMYATAIQQNPLQLAEAALTVSLTRAQSTKIYVTKISKSAGLKKREYQAILDCMEELGDSIDRLNKSVKELKQYGSMKGDDFWFHMSNVQTWASAAETDENTCSDGFSGRVLDGKVKTAVRAKILNVGQVTSNALSLINRFAAKH